MNWKTILLESPEKKVNGKITKPQRVIRGLLEIENVLYYLDYVLFTQFNWWAVVKVQDEVDIETIKNTPPEKYYNSKLNKLVNYEDLPEDIKPLI